VSGIDHSRSIGVAGERLPEADLRDGDVIVLGRVVLRFLEL